MAGTRHLFVAVAFACVSTPCYPQRPPAAHHIIGTWLLESIVDTLPDRSVAHWMGLHPKCAIVYTPSGHVSVQFMRDPRPVLPPADSAAAAGRRTSARPFEGISLGELRAVAEGYYAYFGRYIVSPSGDSITHVVETSLWPSEVGVTYHRAIRLDDQRLYITVRFRESGVLVYRVLTWRRAS